jgi:asparagine synthase (glutamine-hydrolysing)
MTDAIRHRGPDGDGFYAPAGQPEVALGMRRLSIIDVDGSDQPLYNEDRSIALVFNGEIYNYRELRRTLISQGHALRTDGDGETIIHLYEQHGLDLFAHLRGMYAFALWDSDRARLLLAVDHIGMKPLYLCQHDGMLRFASEVKALLTDPAVPRAVHQDVLDTFLSFGYMIGEETLFAGVRRLMPGHMLIAEGGETRIQPFWTFGHDRIGSVGVREGENEGALIDEARARLSESVALHLRSDVPLGLFLSAGVDSAAVLALMAQAGGEVKTFTVGYAMPSRDNELDGAAHIAAHFGAAHHPVVITADDWWREFEHYVYHHDEPNANPSAVSLMLLARETARHVKVVLTGLGGDEVFSGYGSHRTFARIIRERRGGGAGVPALAGALGALEPLYPAFKRWRGLGALPTVVPAWRARFLPRDEALRRTASFDGLVMSDALRRAIYTPALASAWERAQHKERTYAAIVAASMRYAPEDAAQALVINTWLHGNALLNADKVTMAHSLEARVPFFDPPLLDFAARLPADLRMRANKYVLREAMRPLLPAEALERPKKPFETPLLGWFTRDLRAHIAQRLLDPSARLLTWIDRRALEGLLRRHFDGSAPQVEVVFRLLTLELWLRRFM